MSIYGHADCHTVSIDGRGSRMEFTMSFYDYSQPKSGSTFRVIGVGRISTEHQDELSLKDQEQYYRQYLDRELGAGKYQLDVIASQDSGQVLDRVEFIDLCERVESGQYDIVVAEDLGRISRRIHAIVFCEEAEDASTRVIAINDYVDTAQPNWKQASIFASFKNESFCKDTSERIKRTLRNRFENGQIFQCEIFGYVKPAPKADDSQVYKDPDAVPIYEEWFRRLEDGQNYRMIADWLNDQQVPTGNHCKLPKWDGRMVQRVTFNPILKGERIRNRMVAVRVNKTGRSRSQKAPAGHQLSRIVPHLAFIDAERYDRVIRLLTARNSKYKRSESVKNDPRAGIPKRHTRFPGQHIRCGVCGRLYLFGGHGKTERLMCKGVRSRQCWNAMTISGPEVAEAVAAQVKAEIERLKGFDAAWLQKYEEQYAKLAARANSEVSDLEKQLADEKRKLGNQHAALEKLGVSDSIVGRISELDRHVAELTIKLDECRRTGDAITELPAIEAIKEAAASAFSNLAIDSVEFGMWMRKIVDEFYVLPYRLADGGKVQPRLIYRLSLAPLVSGEQVELPILQFDRQVDLFKEPQRAIILDDVVSMVREKMKHADIAEKLGCFKTEVSNAMVLHRKMLAMGLQSPWKAVTSAKQVEDCYATVRHPLFKFEPLDGFTSTKHPLE